MFVLRDKFITQGEKRETETSTKTCNETITVAWQVEGFCISYFAEYFAAFRK